MTGKRNRKLKIRRFTFFQILTIFLCLVPTGKVVHRDRAPCVVVLFKCFTHSLYSFTNQTIFCVSNRKQIFFWPYADMRPKSKLRRFSYNASLLYLIHFYFFLQAPSNHPLTKKPSLRSSPGINKFRKALQQVCT